MLNAEQGNRSPHILLIAPHSSYRTAAYLKAAATLGYEISLASESQHSLIEAFRRGIHIDFTDVTGCVDRLVRHAQKQGVTGLLGTDDLTIEIAHQANRKLGFSQNEPGSVGMARRKDLARQELHKAGLPVPQHRVIELDAALPPQLADFPYPAVIKPVSLSGSRGVMRINSATEGENAVKRIQHILTQATALDPLEKHILLLEKFVPGFEVAVEGLLDKQGFQLLSLFDKPDPMDGPFFEETYYITPSRLPPPVQKNIVETIAQACRALGLRQGPVHAECRVNDDGIWIIEVAARTIGGMCARLFEYGTGYSLEQMVLANLAQTRLPLTQVHEGLGVLMIPIPKAGLLKRINGLQAARQVEFIASLEILIQPGHRLVPLPEGSSYLGFIFSHAPTAQLAEQALREAHKCLHFDISPIWEIH